MEPPRSTRTWTLLGAVLLALTVGVMARRTAPASEGLRDAVASPVPIGGPARDLGYFAVPSARRAEAERLLTASRAKRRAPARAAFSVVE